MNESEPIGKPAWAITAVLFICIAALAIAGTVKAIMWMF